MTINHCGNDVFLNYLLRQLFKKINHFNKVNNLPLHQQLGHLDPISLMKIKHLANYSLHQILKPWQQLYLVK